MQPYQQEPPPPPTPPASTGRSLSLWGAGAGGVLALIALFGQQYLGVVAGLAIAGVALVAGQRMDQREDEIRHQRALDLLLHDPSVLITRIETDGNLDLERLRGMLKKQHIELTETRSRRQDLVRLQQSLTSLQLAAWEKSEKDPSFRATFEQVAGLIATTQSAVDDMLFDDPDNPRKIDDKAREKEAERVSALYLEVLDKLLRRI